MTAGSSGPKPPRTIAQGRFELKKKLGAGCFGEVYRAVEVGSQAEVAVKVEESNCGSQQLEHEANILMSLREASSAPAPQGFAESFYFGKEDKHNVLVLELLGRSLEDRMRTCKSFTPRTAVLVADQVLRRIEFLHSKGVLHRDIKPENWMWGVGPKQHVLHLIDFGLSKRYYDKAHVVLRNKLNLTGTARYASINAHRGLEQSRRDDLEAIGHMLMYFLRGSLPWSGLEAKTKQEKYRKIMEKKISTSLSDLGAGFPAAFEHYLRICRGLGFKERPDYKLLRQLFADVRTELEKEQEAPIYDWELEWIEKSPTGLVPLQHLEVLQPDDPQRIKHTNSRLMCCFCGGNSRVAN